MGDRFSSEYHTHLCEGSFDLGQSTKNALAPYLNTHNNMFTKT